MQSIQVLHGSKNKFSEFKLNHKVSNPVYNSEDYGLGLFFTDSVIMAKWFAGCIEYDSSIEDYISTNEIGFLYYVNINFKKPLIIDNIDDSKFEDSIQKYFALIDKIGGSIKLRQKLIQEGYDSIIIKNCTTNYYADGSYTVYVILNSDQCKIVEIEKI